MQETSISLYFDLEQGQTANLEVVAKAALAWNAMIKDYAAAFAPELGPIQVDFFDATASSARLNNLLKAAGEGDPKALLALAGGIVLFFAMGAAVHLQEDFGSGLLEKMGHRDYVDISPESIDQIADKVVDKVLLERAEKQRRHVVQESSKDPFVKGVGATLLRVGRPSLLIPRSEFHTLGDEGQKPVSGVVPRVDLDLPVILLRPNLKEDSDGLWRFWNEAEGEFSAKIADEEFVEALRQRRSGIEMGFGIQMRVDLLTREEQVDGVWQVKDRTVKRVVWPPINRRQSDLGLEPPKQ